MEGSWWNKWWLAQAYQYGFDFGIASKNNHISEHISTTVQDNYQISASIVFQAFETGRPFWCQPHRHRKRSSTPPHERQLGKWAMAMATDGYDVALKTMYLKISWLIIIFPFKIPQNSDLGYCVHPQVLDSQTHVACLKHAVVPRCTQIEDGNVQAI